MKKIFIIFLITLTIIPVKSYCQMIRATKEMGNYRDAEVYVDTTGISDNLYELSKTNKRLYSKNGFIFFIEVEAIKIPKAPPDSIIELTWSSIDTSYKSLRQGFKNLEKQFSTYKLRKIYPELTKGIQSQRFEIRFENLVNVDSIISYLNNLNYVNKRFRYGLDFPTYIPNDRSLKPRTPLSEIQVSNPSTFYPPNWHKLGFGWNIYAMKGPMAWEITKGKEDIVIAVYDLFDNPFTHPDLDLRTSSTDPGNWIQVTPATSGDGISCTTEPPKTDHGITTLPLAIALMDNDNLSSPPSGGMVGISPKCRGIAFHGDPQDDDEFRFVDTDLEVNYDTLKIAVISYSFGNVDAFNYDDYKHMMEAGIVLCGSAGNNLGDACNCSGILTYTGRGTSTTSGYYRYWYPIKKGRGANVYTPVKNDPTKDYKGLSVSATKDGSCFDYKCDPWGCPVSSLPNWKGNEHFINNWCYSPGTDKFNTDYNITENSATFRRAQKEDAYVDIAAPGHSVLTPSIDGNERKYDPNVSGTSQSSPELAGVCGLMLSINKYMGVELDATYYRPVDGPEVQRMVYDAITFTADKLIDDGKSKTPYECNNKFQFLANPIQPDYVTQANDNLKRTWAQRMGFGRVNAYRAVAHTIRQKGEYKYSLSGNYTIPFASDDGSGDSRGYVNPDGKKIMHWGSQVKEGTGDFEMPIWRGPNPSNDGVLNVLEWGGISFPDEYHNNQGVTIVSNTFSQSRVKVTIPDECILAVDGYLVSDQPNSAHYIYANGSGTYSGKILMEGYLQDIEIFGNLRIGDVTVSSTTLSEEYGMPGCIGFGSGTFYTSEIYGDVTILDTGIIYNLGRLRMKPGSSVDLQGDYDFLLQPGSETHLEYASTVTGKDNRKIWVDNNATLYIDHGANVDILCELHIANGGTVILQDSCIANVKKLFIEPNGQLFCQSGSHLALIDLEHFCYGRIFFSGADTNRTLVSGRIGEHCRPDADTLYHDYDNVLTQPTIYVFGDCDYPDNSYLSSIYTDFKDISIYAYNVKTEPVRYCNFTADSRQTNPHMQFDYLLSLIYDKCVECEDTMITRKTVEFCNFYDLAGPNNNPLHSGDPNKYTYNTGGLMAEGLEYLWNFNNLFKGLEYGIWTIRCDSVHTTFCQFDTSGIGDYDKASFTWLCGNVYNLVEFGSIRDHSLGGRVFDNTYNYNRIAFNIVSGLWQGFRSNIFNEFYYGIQSTCNEFYLGPKPIGGQNAYIYGGNLFTVTNPTPYINNPDEYPNPFVYVLCDTNTADVNLVGDCCTLYMYCGYNNMATYTKHHLRHDQPGNTPTVNVSVNKFNDPSGFAVRAYDVTTPGSPINVSASFTQNCSDSIGLYECVTITYKKDDKDKINFVKDVEPELLELTYNNAVNILMNEELSYDIRRDAAYYLYIISKNNLSNERLLELAEEYSIISTDDQNSIKLRADISYLSGLVFEKLGEYEDAAESYSKFKDVYPYDLSLISLDWSSLYNELKTDAYENENRYDVNLDEYLTRVIGNIRSSVEQTCNRNQFVDVFDNNNSITQLYQNIPNPFDNETIITYTLEKSCNVRLLISDILGSQILKLVEEWQESGLHSMTFSNKNFPNGVYLYRLEACGQVITKQMLIIK